MSGEEEKANGIESVLRIPSRPPAASTISAHLDERFGSGVAGPLRVRPRAKFPAEFRTLRSDFRRAFLHCRLFYSAALTSPTRKRAVLIQSTSITLKVRSEFLRRLLLLIASSDLSELEWHSLSVNEVCLRLNVSPKSGLDSNMAARRLRKNGKNVISPPPNNLLKKIFFYFFGGTMQIHFL
jgi:magnesium-transporting ATPase (P-type)